MVELWTDGSCRSNGINTAKGGWAYTVFFEDELIKQDSGKELNTTNQRMEMLAIIKGLEFLEKNNYKENSRLVTIYTDSAYCLNCWKQGWWRKWQEKDWISSKKEPVKNKDLWEKLIPWFSMNEEKFYMIKVKGHSGIEKNELVDKLAQAAGDL